MTRVGFFCNEQCYRFFIVHWNFIIYNTLDIFNNSADSREDNALVWPTGYRTIDSVEDQKVAIISLYHRYWFMLLYRVGPFAKKRKAPSNSDRKRHSAKLSFWLESAILHLPCQLFRRPVMRTYTRPCTPSHTHVRFRHRHGINR